MEISKEIPNQAKQAALNWLDLIDSKKYSQAYSLAAPYFKEKVNEKSWINIIKSTRKSRSPIAGRKLLGSKYFTSLPDAPDGEYFVIQFSSESPESIETIETITPVLDGGQWKVCGYYIK
jgi:hypothetical protein